VAPSGGCWAGTGSGRTSRAAGDVLELAVGTGLNLPLYVLGINLSEAMPD